MSTSTLYYFVDSLGFGMYSFMFTMLLTFVVIGLGTQLMRHE